MSNESKQSSPIGVEQAAKEFSENEWPILSEEDYYKRGNDEPYYDYSATSQVIQFAIKKGFIAGSQWASSAHPTAVNGDDELREFIGAMVAERDAFIDTINKQKWNSKMRAAAETLIICYDLLIDRLEPDKSKPKAAPKADDGVNP